MAIALVSAWPDGLHNEGGIGVSLADMLLTGTTGEDGEVGTFAANRTACRNLLRRLSRAACVSRATSGRFGGRVTLAARSPAAASEDATPWPAHASSNPANVAGRIPRYGSRGAEPVLSLAGPRRRGRTAAFGTLRRTHSAVAPAATIATPAGVAAPLKGCARKMNTCKEVSLASNMLEQLILLQETPTVAASVGDTASASTPTAGDASCDSIGSGMVGAASGSAGASRIEPLVALHLPVKAARALLDALTCPITRMPMEEPVVAADGYTYEAHALRRWLCDGHCKSPMAGTELKNRQLRPNLALRAIAQALAAAVSGCP